jgi:hypothetical protein
MLYRLAALEARHKINIMKIEFANTFFDSIKRIMNQEKWYWKTWDFIRYDGPRFLKNLWLFRKNLYEYRWYSGQHAVLPFMQTAIMDIAVNVDRHGHEVEESKSKKVMKMWRVSLLMQHFIDDDFINLAEYELGDIIHHDWEFEDVPEQPGYQRLIDNDTLEEKEHNSKVFERARLIEESMWAELWDILKGQDYTLFNKESEWTDQFDGTGLRGWWD